MKKQSYHNTTNESGDQLEMFENKANKQETVILSMFRRTGKMTASECFRLYPDQSIPITSVRRGITNLMKAGFLIKLDGMQDRLEGEEPDPDKIEKKEGIYGRKEYVYELNLNK